MIFGEYDREMDIAVNREEARKEEKLIIAKKLLNKGSTPEFVNEVTGLPPEKINLIVDSNLLLVISS
jgi:hypothetical protein